MRLSLLLALGMATLISLGAAQQAPAGGAYKVLKTAKVGGEGGFDYIFADVAARLARKHNRSHTRANAPTARTYQRSSGSGRLGVARCTWWQQCTLGPLNLVEFRLHEKATSQILAGAWLWEIAWLTQARPRPWWASRRKPPFRISDRGRPDQTRGCRRKWIDGRPS